MTLSQRLTEYISACFTGLWMQSAEHDDALAEIAQMCRQENWRLAVWDVERRLANPGPVHGPGGRRRQPTPWPPSAPSMPWRQPDSSALLVLVNFHRFLQSAEIVQALAQQISAGKQSRAFVVILSPICPDPRGTGEAAWSSRA